MQKATFRGASEVGRAPDPVDFDDLVRTYRPKIFGYALLSLRDRDAAETVTQDCFMRAHHSLHLFRNECSLKTWLMRIVVNLVRDQIRSQRFQFWKQLRASSPVLPLESYGEHGGMSRSPEAEVIMKEDAAAVWSAVKTLPDRQKTVFLLHFVEDMDILEIVEATGMKEGTVKAHLFRAVRSLRKRLAAN